MGEIAEMILDGTLCEGCGVYIGDEVGYPRTCSSCKKGGHVDLTTTKNGTPIYRPSKVNCPRCHKLVKKGQGLKDHLRVVHGAGIA